MKRGKMLRAITEKAGLHSEPIAGIPLLELNGDDRILIENHKCVMGYTEKEIMIRVSFGTLRITGEGMVLACVKKEQLVIYGTIHSICLLRGG